MSSGSGSKVKNDGLSRYCCYLCDYSLCRACVDRQDKLLTCLQNLCDKVTWTLLILILILVFILILILSVQVRDKVAEETKIQRRETSLDVKV